MTEPVIVGTVAVEVTASASKLAKSLKAEVEKAFKDLDFSKAIQDALGKTKIKLPVDLDPNTDTIGEKVRKTRTPKVPVDLDPNTDTIGEKVKRTRVPKVPVELDPVLQAFQQEIRRQTAALARHLNVSVPVGADTSGLREELGAQLAAIKAQSRIQVPTEPGGKAEYEARLKAQLAEVAARVKQTVHVDVDVDKRGSSALAAIGGLIKGFGKGLPNFGGIANGISELGGAIQKAAGSSAQLGGSLAGAATTATGPIGLVIGLLATAAAGMVALAAAATFAVPAISAVAGAAAAIPAALVGAAAGIGTLALGFKGIAAAFKPKAGGGGGGSGQDAESQARRIAGAERGVESARRGIAAATRALQAAERGYDDAVEQVSLAQARAAKAQDAVNQARKEAKEDIEDLGRALRGAQLDEEDAALGVQDALRALNEAKLTGNLPDIQRAELAYRRAQLTLENATDSAGDLGDEQAEAAAKGVEGSDKVQSALEDQAAALRGVEDAQNGVLDAQNALLSANDGLKSSYDSLLSAQDALAESQKSVAAGAAAAGAQVVKLAPAAQKFVDAIKALKPAFEDLRLDVQQRLFEGLDKTVTNLGKAWIPALKVTLGSYADTFNGFFKNLGSSLGQPKFISDIQAGAEGARAGLAKIGDSITTSLVPAFGALSRAAGPFLDKLGEEIADVVTEFSNWVLQGEKTGGLKEFFDTAAKSVHDLFTTGKLAFKIVGDLVGILIGTSLAKGKTPLESFNDQLQKLHDFLSSAKGKKAVTDFVENIKAKFEDFVGVAQKIGDFVGKVNGFFDGSDTEKVKSAGVLIGQALVSGIIAGFGAAVVASFTSLGAIAQAIVDKVKEVLGISSPSTVMMSVGVDLALGLINGLLGMFGSIVSTVAQIPGRILGALGDTASLLVASGRNVVSGLINGAVSLAGTLSQRVTDLRTRIFNTFATAGSLLVTAGRNTVIGLINGIGSYVSALATRAAGLRTTIANQLSNAGSLLVNAGRNIVIGLINGIASMIGTLGNYLGQIGSFIQAHKGPIEKDRQLLVGAGRAIMDGLIGGIDDRKTALAAQLSDVSGLIAGTQMPALASDLGGVSASLNKSATLELAWAPGSTSDKVYRAIQDDIKLRWSGNVQAALGSG